MKLDTLQDIKQATAAARAATLTPEERARALQAIEDRRAALTAELAQLDAITAGHQAALDDPSE